MTVTLNGVEISSKLVDPCDLAEQYNSSVQCPIAEGNFESSSTFALSEETFSGWYSRSVSMPSMLT